MATATISADGRYRYRLERQWSTLPALGWVMLNPSTADAHVDDPTIRKCIGFAQRMGYGGIVVGNLFAYRATDPDHLLGVIDPCGPENDLFLRKMVELPRIIAGWGAFNHKRLDPSGTRVAAVRKILPTMENLATTKHGHPRHPLYLPYPKEL